MNLCESCKRSFFSPTGKARFCGYDCQSVHSKEILRRKKEALAALPATVQEASVVVTPATIERDFPGVFLLEWAQ